MTYKSNETWLQDSHNADLWHTHSGLMINSAALKEREAFYDVERVYNRNETQESWAQDEMDSEIWHGDSGLILNTAALEERETYFAVERVYAIEPYLNMRDYNCASC